MCNVVANIVVDVNVRFRFHTSRERPFTKFLITSACVYDIHKI